MGRIEDRLADLRKRGKKALVYFLTAGFPLRDSTEGIAEALEQGGADMLEIGMPFSDPLADGPVIQRSSWTALQNGINLDAVLTIIAAIRSRSSIPLILMGYLNPIVEFGAEKFFSSAAKSGVDGVILPELPLEEVGRFRNEIDANGISQILLVTPTTPSDRIRKIDSVSHGFLYCVSTAGVTGSGHGSDIGKYITRVRTESSRNPLLVGFGISSPADAASVAKDCDGVIVGSALIKRLDQPHTNDQLRNWVKEFRTAIDAVKT
ncbi:MAG TPA: tryptophan synthase subunit alpha [Bacteroidota bacterium]